MGDAAHAESLNRDHEVYRTPFAVQPEFESWNTPDNYKRSQTGPDKLPEKMKVWLVQKTGKQVGGVVAWGAGFTDSPDAEIWPWVSTWANRTAMWASADRATSCNGAIRPHHRR
jgi:hypothetical protein